MPLSLSYLNYLLNQVLNYSLSLHGLHILLRKYSQIYYPYLASENIFEIEHYLILFLLKTFQMFQTTILVFVLTHNKALFNLQTWLSYYK